MKDKDIVREQNYINRIEVFKERTDEFFANYENLSGGEECLEVCLIRDGCRAVSQAEETINRLQAENKKNENIIRLADKTIETANAEIERLKEENENLRDSLAKKKFKDEMFEMTLGEYKAEAYKECIEKVMETALVIKENAFQGCYVISKGNLDNLLKELVGDK